MIFKHVSSVTSPVHVSGKMVCSVTTKANASTGARVSTLGNISLLIFLGRETQLRKPERPNETAIAIIKEDLKRDLNKKIVYFMNHLYFYYKY